MARRRARAPRSGVPWQAVALALAPLSAPAQERSTLAPLPARAPERPALALVGLYDSGLGKGTEIVSVQAATQRAVLSCSARGCVDVLDLRLPRAPRRLERHDLGLAAGEQLTSVAVHPREPLYLTAIRAAAGQAPGRVELRALAEGKLLKRIPVGVGPDSVVFSDDGRSAAVACESEEVRFERERGEFLPAAGSVTLLELQDLERPRARSVDLPSAAGVEGMLAEGDVRRLERSVDWNGNGAIDAQWDFDGDGTIGENEVQVGLCGGMPVLAAESRGERFLLPLQPAAEWLEPEALAFAPGGERLYVTLQEHNGLLAIDVAEAKVVALVGAGSLAGEGACLQREPDGICAVPGGRWLVSADEGDTRCPQPGRRARTLSVFDRATLSCLGDTGGDIDRLALEAGIDAAIVEAGVQPEMVVSFSDAGRTWAAATLERADALVLVALDDPARPAAVALARCRSGAATGSSPEGLAWLRERLTGELFVLTANEGDGTLSVFQVRQGP